jgi:alkylhydroperoxidase family enzyme
MASPGPWLRPGQGGLARQLELVPELAQGYAQFLASLESVDGVPRRLLELCRLRIAQIHGCAAQLQAGAALAPVSDADQAQLAALDLGAFEAPEQAALALAEKMPLAHHEVTDAEVEALKTALGERPAMAVIVALSFFDVQCRLNQTLATDAND